MTVTQPASSSQPRSEELEHARSVLIVGNFLSPEMGGWAVCESLAAELRGSGWAVLTTSSRRNRLARLWDMVATTVRNRRNYAVAQVDVYSGRAFVWAECVALALRRCGRPFVLTLHGGGLPAFARRWPRRVRRLLGQAAAVTAPSRYLFEQMRAWRGDLRLIPNGLDLGSYRYRRRDGAGPELLWLRAFHRIYNPAMAVRAVANLQHDFPSVRLTMIGRDCGDGTLAEAQSEAEALGVSDRIAFHGPVPKTEVPSRLDGADILINTPDVDNTPVSVLEALASGVCVVSTDAGGIPYLLEDGKTALLVPRDDDRAMAAAVARLLVDRTLAAGLSSSGRESAAAADWSRVRPQWEDLLRRVGQGAPA